MNKHKAIMSAWAAGAKIQTRSCGGAWIDTGNPSFEATLEYRVKPGEKVSKDIAQMLYEAGFLVSMFAKNGMHAVGVAHEDSSGPKTTLLPKNDLIKQVRELWQAEEYRKFRLVFPGVDQASRTWQAWIARAEQHPYQLSAEGEIIYA